MWEWHINTECADFVISYQVRSILYFYINWWYEVNNHKSTGCQCLQLCNFLSKCACLSLACIQVLSFNFICQFEYSCLVLLPMWVTISWWSWHESYGWDNMLYKAYTYVRMYIHAYIRIYVYIYIRIFKWTHNKYAYMGQEWISHSNMCYRIIITTRL